MLILGVETSCDETSVALTDGPRIIESVTYTQLEHGAFGGVVPELASRAHLQKIDRLTEQVLARHTARLADIDLIAVTDSPGLAGALLVGVSFSLGLSRGYGIQVAGVHHLEGHICAAMIEQTIAFPFLALVVSGGHTVMYRVDDIGRYQCLGQTVDDAAGEAFDKVGKLLGYTYPAGRTIDEAAKACESAGDLRFPIARPATSRHDFSFSGLKTAVKYHVEQRTAPLSDLDRGRICKAFQHATVEALVQGVQSAATAHGLERIVCTGGVAANGALRARLREVFGQNAYVPSPKYCTDNAAMIARAGYERATRCLLVPPRMSPSRELC